MNNLYKVKSLNVVAYLRLKGFPLAQATKEFKDVAFYFEKSNELFAAIDEYNSNADLKKFISSFKEVRTIANSLK